MSEPQYAVAYSPKALDDLRDIYSYIAFSLKVPGTAQKQINRIRSEVRSLGFMPQRYAVVDWEPWHSMGMHKLPVDNFLVYYLTNADTRAVTVIRIFYGGRDAESIINSETE